MDLNIGDELRQRLDVLISKQVLLLDEILEDMDNSEPNSQLKAMAGEKHGIIEPDTFLFKLRLAAACGAIMFKTLERITSIWYN